jgi:tripeptide aminopeptidase
VITVENHPYLNEKIGDDLITASGLTLLGADDKAGVAVIMHAAEYLMKHPEVKHGKIRILFTPDEEIGRGVDAVDMKKLGADFGYTLDGGECPHLEGECFSADAAIVTFHGVSAHPGYAKGKLKNAIKIAADFVASLPKTTWNPESTEGHEGFVHPVDIRGGAETAIVQFIVRDFDSAKLAEYEQKLEQYAKDAVAAYEGATYEMVVKQQYRNMKEVLDQHPEVMEIAAKAYQQAGLTPKHISIRGGTDGARLSFMGLPCPNIFTGEMGIHSRQEYVSVQDMEKSAEVCIHLATITAE